MRTKICTHGIICTISHSRTLRLLDMDQLQIRVHRLVSGTRLQAFQLYLIEIRLPLPELFYFSEAFVV